MMKVAETGWYNLEHLKSVLSKSTLRLPTVAELVMIGAKKGTSYWCIHLDSSEKIRVYKDGIHSSCNDNDNDKYYHYAIFIGEEEMEEQKNSRPDVSHYKGKIEVIDFIHAHDLNFNRGNVVKYTVRAGKKDPSKEIEDLQKAIDYLNFEIERIKTWK